MKILLCCALFCPQAIFAVDGIILIDQNRVLAGGITPGDLPGFPATLSQPGSYRLSGNLTVPSGQNGIEVSARDITIDLNGFSITTPVQDASVSSSRGIYFTGAGSGAAIRILNGAIEGFPLSVYLSIGTSLCQHCTLEHLILNWGLPGASSGFSLGSYSLVRDVSSGTADISVLCPSVVSETAARSVSVYFALPGDPNVNVGKCAFANNATSF